MQPRAIFGPFLAMMLITLAVWIFLFVRRIHFINTNRLSPVELAVPGRLAELSPASVSNPSDNFKNLFEIPVLFYAMVLYLFVAGRVDAVAVGACWVFVAFRALHSLVHCTINLVMLRFWMYALAASALWFLVLREAIAWIAG